MEVTLEPLTEATIGTYTSVGTESYNEHYPHLWENGDTSMYIKKSFTDTVVAKELKDPNIEHFLVNFKGTFVGIVKLITDCAIDEFSKEESLLAQKIYLLRAYSGMGLGKNILHLIEKHARKMNKSVIWLDTMQKGNPIRFYLKQGFEIKKESELTLEGAKPTEKAMWVLTKQL